jgi:hypothetical protein
MFTLRKSRAQNEGDRSPKRSTIRAGVTAAGMLCIILSATVRTWWQTFLLDFGIGLLLVGIVELAFLGVLRRVLGGESGAPTPKPALTQAELDSVRRLINRTDGQDWRGGIRIRPPPGPEADGSRWRDGCTTLRHRTPGHSPCA